jgi:predicted permease
VARVEVTQPRTGGGKVPVTLQDLAIMRDAASMTRLGAFRAVGGTLVDPQLAATRVSAALLTAEVFPLLAVAPAVGRVPTSDEAETGVLLGFDLWQELYGGDLGALGRTVELDGRSRVIMGVMPDGFGFPFRQNLWAILPEAPGDDQAVELVGRLAEGASLETATAELAGRWVRGEEWREEARRGGVVEVRGFTGGRGERGEGVAFLGLVLVALALLLIACANVANLLLVRATERVRSLGVQAALGAGRIQLSAQLFLEALFLALLGGATGLLTAWVGIDAIQRSLAEEHFGYFWMRMAVDSRVMFFTSLLIVGTAVFAGTLPVLRILGVDLHGTLKSGGGGVAKGGSWGKGFVTTQLALSCATLAAAGLAALSLAGSSDLGEGVPGDEILLASLDPAAGAEMSGQAWDRRLAALEDGLSAVVGPGRAALALGAPGYGEAWGSFEVEGEEAQRPEDRRRVYWNAVTSAYFSLLDLELRLGRRLDPGDGTERRGVAVVSESFVERHMGGGDPLGRRIRVDGADAQAAFTIVGVVEDLKLGGNAEKRSERVYLSLSQISPRGAMAIVRAERDPAKLTPAVREAVAGVDSRIPLWSVRTLTDAHAYMIRVYRAIEAMALAGGIAGLLVATVGLYGLLAFRVRQRRRELGIRLALGADGPRLIRETMTVALRQLLPATGVGLALAWVVAPVLGVILLGQNPRSPLVFLGVGIAFVSVGLLAALVPARRAAALQPAETLRGE